MSSNGMIHVIEGDTLTLTIKGKVVNPNKANGPEATTLRIYRPAKSSLYAATYPKDPSQSAVSVNVTFDPSAEITHTVESQFKNGVHLDKDGRYWMKREDGFHEMTVKPIAVPSLSGTQFVPRGLQRLKEDKDT